MHAHGPGLSQRKRLFIKPVFVNRHLLAESQNPFATSYRVAAGNARSLDEVQSAVREQTATTASMAQASQELTNISVELQSVVSRFKLE